MVRTTTTQTGVRGTLLNLNNEQPIPNDLVTIIFFKIITVEKKLNNMSRRCNNTKTNIGYITECIAPLNINY